MASANVSRSQPRSAESGSVNSPKLVRVPNVMIAIRHPAAITTLRLRHQGVVLMRRQRITFGSVIELNVLGSRAMPLGSDYEGQNCSLARSLEVVGERWTLLILRDLFFGVRRFGELQAHLDIPRAVLSARLATLVEHGLVERRPYRPGRDELLLTACALELWPAVYRAAPVGRPPLRRRGPARAASSRTPRAAPMSTTWARARPARASPSRPSS